MSRTTISRGRAAAACMGVLAWSALAASCGQDADPAPQVAEESEGGSVVGSGDDVGEAAGDGEGSVAAPGPAMGREGADGGAGVEGQAVAAGQGADAARREGSAGASGDAMPVAGVDAGDDSAAENEDPPPTPVQVLPGVRLTATADWEVSAERHAPGDPVSATVAEDYAPGGGPVLISQGTRLLGRVKVAETAQGPGETPFLEIGFETLSATDYERPVETLVVETGPAPDQGVAQPGTIQEGAPLVIEIRRALELPPLVPPTPTSGSPDTGVPSPDSAR